MGPLSYMLSVVDQNVVMRRIPNIYIYAWGKNSGTLARWLRPNFQFLTLNFYGFFNK